MTRGVDTFRNYKLALLTTVGLGFSGLLSSCGGSSPGKEDVTPVDPVVTKHGNIEITTNSPSTLQYDGDVTSTGEKNYTFNANKLIEGNFSFYTGAQAGAPQAIFILYKNNIKKGADGKSIAAINPALPIGSYASPTGASLQTTTVKNGKEIHAADSVHVKTDGVNGIPITLIKNMNFEQTIETISKTSINVKRDAVFTNPDQAKFVPKI